MRSVSREPLESQVLLTSEGRQMESGEPIGSYSVGTVSAYHICIFCVCCVLLSFTEFLLLISFPVSIVSCKH